VAFVVPARDEEGLIGDCVRAIAKAAEIYPGRVDAIVVENGSTDRTTEEVRAAFAASPQMRSTLLHTPAHGKSRALNVGLANADAEIVVRVDADTLVSPDLLVRLIPHFWKQRVGGVGVVPVPREQRGWIAHMRAIETYYGAAFKRVAQNVVDCVTVLPGATVAYPRTVLVDAGGFAEGVNGEDADITVRVGRMGYRIISDWRIRTSTDVPHNFSQLREQRIRWSRGLYHMIGRNRSAIWMRQGLRGMWMLPWAAFMMFRKLMLIPFAIAAAAMVAVHPSTLPLRQVAAAGAILLGVQLIQMTVVLLLYGKPGLICVLPSYLVFRLIVTYYALEALLTLAFAGPQHRSAPTTKHATALRPLPASSGPT
jgi:cellulose synthase/poly-beta-1,6-N-acetylglucosamine synthase-like glycosyltransferase